MSNEILYQDRIVIRLKILLINIFIPHHLYNCPTRNLFSNIRHYFIHARSNVSFLPTVSRCQIHCILEHFKVSVIGNWCLKIGETPSWYTFVLKKNHVVTAVCFFHDPINLRINSSKTWLLIDMRNNCLWL